jgi:hypothetical protein
MEETPQHQPLDALVKRLDGEIERSGAGVMVTEADGLPGYKIVGNRCGLLRLGVELMKAALQLPPDGSRAVTGKLSYLRIEDEETVSAIFRNDDLHDPEKRYRTKVGFWGLMWILAFAAGWILLLICLAVGFMTVAKSLVQWYVGG